MPGISERLSWRQLWWGDATNVDTKSQITGWNRTASSTYFPAPDSEEKPNDIGLLLLLKLLNVLEGTHFACGNNESQQLGRQDRTSIGDEARAQAHNPDADGDCWYE